MQTIVMIVLTICVFLSGAMCIRVDMVRLISTGQPLVVGDEVYSCQLNK